ncbi:DUF5655 domain-containing protein [Gulosibacter molinativorax]|uniref:DUF5655 domain-containing protein n=1 Tax=Gulosibacter molinativorax TaxID=256821 RepID=A0ABT7C6W1_9MICO|nr:DUF5655 domain-containing protein [Gulosibacter molinativorax]MDJ1370897.1 hypothetical protein [Gulosibacter molinativorax]QUY62234.1 Hypotetical protein [Gulosibacter molinativorax]
MATGSNKMISDFASKPKTQSFYTDIVAFVTSFGPVTQDAKAQVSFSVNRKFLWLWAYEKTADGTLYLNVMLDKRIDDPHFHAVNQVSKHRWNHHVEVKSPDMANSDWLRDLIRAGYAFASVT